MDVTEDAVRDICTDAVFERGERYLAEDVSTRFTASTPP